MDVRIQHRAPTRVVFVPHVGPYQEVGKAWAALRGALRPDAALGAPFAIAYDDPEVTDPASVRYDACLPVADDFVPGPGLSVKTVEAGDYAVAVHEGAIPRRGPDLCRALRPVAAALRLRHRRPAVAGSLSHGPEHHRAGRSPNGDLVAGPQGGVTQRPQNVIRSRSAT